MLVSKINLINTYNKRVLPFKGDTLNNTNKEKKPDSKKRLDNPTKFLIGSLAGGAALVGLVYGAKHGLLGKTIKNKFNGFDKASKDAEKSTPQIIEKIEEIIPSLKASIVKSEKEADIKLDGIPKDPYHISYKIDKIDKTKGDGFIAASLTNIENKIVKSDSGEQVDKFTSYLNYVIKDFTPDEARKFIIFRPGRYAINQNVKIAKRAIEIAKENPDYAPAIVNNLLSYETPAAFSSELAHSSFKYTEHLAPQIDKHMKNLIEIRKLLKKAGLPCDEFSRLKARRDWLDNGYHTPNTYLLGFQNASDMPKFKKVAFEYDMSLGIDSKTAEEIIKVISSDLQDAKSIEPEEIQRLINKNYKYYFDNSTTEEEFNFAEKIKKSAEEYYANHFNNSKPLFIEKELGLNLVKIIEKINKAVINKPA